MAVKHPVLHWPDDKKALFTAVCAEALNDGHYINAYELTDRLYAALVPYLGSDKRGLDGTCKSDCDCMVCRNRRHREAVWARHNAGQDYTGIRARIMERVNESRDPDWKRP